ncbi:MAG: ATP-binding protein [Myxococcota bacterium]
MEARQPSSKSCTQCHGRMYLYERRGEHAAAVPCTCIAQCPRCEGRGYVYGSREETFSQKVGPKTYDVLSPCSCRLLDKRLARFNEADIPAVLAGADFESYRPHNSEQARAKETVMEFAFRYPDGRGFVLSGSVGTGKTHLLVAALAHAIVEKGARAQYVEVSLLYATIRRGFQEGKSGGEIIGPLSEVELLAIDELGKGRGSPFEMETLDELIARRYNAGRATLFATNFSLAPPEARRGGYRSTEDLKSAAKESHQLSDRVGERIFSRLSEMCQFVELPPGTPDMRRMRHETASTHARRPRK